jgi:hypothetical protein
LAKAYCLLALVRGFVELVTVQLAATRAERGRKLVGTVAGERPEEGINASSPQQTCCG